MPAPAAKAHYYSFIDKATYEGMVAQGKFKFSHRAMQAALPAALAHHPRSSPPPPTPQPPLPPPPLPVLPPTPYTTTFITNRRTPTLRPKAALLVNLYQDEPILNQARPLPQRY